MTVTPQGGFGLAMQIDVSGTPTTLVGVRAASFPKFVKMVAESTVHTSTSGYYEATATGKRRVMPFSVVLGWDTSDATHAAVVTAFDSDDPVTISVADPDGDETIAFEAIIEEVERISEQEDIYIANVLIHPTGAPTIT